MPVHDDRRLFEFLVLEGAQAGLELETILCSGLTTAVFSWTSTPRASPACARRRSKKSCGIPGSCATARRSKRPSATPRHSWQFQHEFGSFDAFVWRFTGGKPLMAARRRSGDVPAFSPESEALSAELRKRGFRFVGPTICYAFMQAVGMVNDHLIAAGPNPSDVRIIARPIAPEVGVGRRKYLAAHRPDDIVRERQAGDRDQFHRRRRPLVPTPVQAADRTVVDGGLARVCDDHHVFGRRTASSRFAQAFWADRCAWAIACVA